MIVLKRGNRNNNVIKLQLLLSSYLNPSIKLKNDGYFGKKTEEAVKAFQKQKGLSVYGIVGSNTWKALSGKTSKVPSKTHSTFRTVGAFWYDIAVAEMGVKELLGASKNNKRIIEYHSTTTLGAKTDEVPWCSSFVNWIMIQAGIKGTNNALAKSWAAWGQEVKTPCKGDIIIIRRKNKKSDAATGSSTGYHVGFYINSTADAILILGGNQRNQVKKSNFLLKSYEVVAYRRPAIRIIGVPLTTRFRTNALA